jgi:arginase family enzyme
MARYGAQFGPDFTFLGVPECDLDDETSYADVDVVILGAPFDGGTSSRAGTRFGPQAIRMTDYLPHDGSRPSLALRADGLRDLKVYDAGDVEMYSGDIEVALPALEAAVQKVVQAGAIPVSLGGDHSIAYPDAKGCANVIGAGRVSMIHFDAHADTGGHRIRLAVGARAAHASVDRVRRPTWRPVPADRAPRLLATAGHSGLDGSAAHALLRDDRDRAAGPARVLD